MFLFRMYLKTILLCAFIVLNSLVESVREERPKVKTWYVVEFVNYSVLYDFQNLCTIDVNKH